MRLAVGPGGGHRVVGLGDSEDPRLERDRLAADAAGIAVAVGLLVAVEDPLADVGQLAGAEDPAGHLGVAADLVPLGRRERPGLVEDRVGDADLADVVQHAGQPQALYACGEN